MMRIDLFLFGYRILEIEKSDVKLAAKLFLKNKINVKIKNSTVVVSELKYKEISRLMADRVKFKASELKGFPGFVYKNRKKYGAFCALLFTNSLLNTFVTTLLCVFWLNIAPPFKVATLPSNFTPSIIV